MFRKAALSAIGLIGLTGCSIGSGSPVAPTRNPTPTEIVSAPNPTPTTLAEIAPTPTATITDAAPTPTLFETSTLEQPAPSPEPSITATVAQATATNVPIHAAALFDQHLVALVGTIGDNAVHMQLYVNEDRLGGMYFYDRIRAEQGMPQNLQLSGTFDDQGNVHLIETDATTPTGSFDGTLSENPDGVIEFSGTWSNAEGTQSLPFTLAQPAAQLTAFDLRTQTIERSDVTPAVTYVAAYPQLEGMEDRVAAFNQQAETLVAQRLDNFRTQMSQWNVPPDLSGAAASSSIDIVYETTIASDNVISVLFRVLSYAAGAAHPSHETFVLNYDLRTGTVLALGDLFKADAPYLDTIAQKAQDRLEGRPFVISLDGAVPTPENYKSWNIEPDGLRITFDPYQVAAYAAGSQEVFIPYAELHDMINPDGVLAGLEQ